MQLSILAVHRLTAQNVHHAIGQIDIPNLRRLGRLRPLFEVQHLGADDLDMVSGALKMDQVSSIWFFRHVVSRAS
jgi:hypothetical protein